MNGQHTLPWPVIGHDWAVELLQRAIAAGRPPHALLITGPPGVGKGTLAHSLAQALLCIDDRRPCGQCRACRLVADNAHPDVHWVLPQGQSLKIEQVRALNRQLVLAPVEGSWQVAVLDQFESATAGAANALLKTLEEPSPNVMLILLAQQAEALLPTIVSRCQVLALRPIPQPAVERALQERWSVEPEQARLLSHLCGGRLGWAVRAAADPALMDKHHQAVDDLLRVLQGSRVERLMYAEALARQSRSVIAEQFEMWTSWWRDVLLLRAGSSAALTHIGRRAELERLAARGSIQEAQAALAAIYEALAQLEQNANPRLVVEALLLRLE